MDLQMATTSNPRQPTASAYDLSQPAVRRLPGEVVLHILRFMLDAEPLQPHQLKPYVRSTLPLQQINRRWKLAVDWAIGLRLHAFISPTHTGTHDERSPWHVSVHDPISYHREYWTFHQGPDTLRKPVISDVLNTLTYARVPTLRCISFDLRPHEPLTKNSLRNWKTVHAPRWIHTSSILTRMVFATRGLEELNLRISAQQELIDLVEELVARNPRLRKISIEVDSAIVNGRNIRPWIRLDNMFPKSSDRSCLERLVIRAPGCNISFHTPLEDQTTFFSHLRDLQEFGMVCSTFKTSVTNQWWIYRLLEQISSVKLCEIAIDAADRRATPLTVIEYPTLRLSSLIKLSLQFAELDTRLLKALDAKRLFKLRLGTKVPVKSWPVCDDNHFPNIFVAHICAPGPSALRLIALGIKPRFFNHNLTSLDNHRHSHSSPFLAYIKPYSRFFQRVPPNQSFAPGQLIAPYSVVHTAAPLQVEQSAFTVAQAATSQSSGSGSPLTSLGSEDGLLGPVPPSGSSGDIETPPSAATHAPPQAVSTDIETVSSATAHAPAQPTLSPAHASSAVAFAHSVLALSSTASGSSVTTPMDMDDVQDNASAGPSRKRART